MHGSSKLTFGLTLALLLVYPECIQSQESGDLFRCNVQYKCSAEKELVWAMADERCHVFHNNCLLKVEQCARINSGQSELIETTKEICKPKCVKKCMDTYDPVCAQIFQEEYITFSNQCEMRNYICTNERLFSLLPSSHAATGSALQSPEIARKPRGSHNTSIIGDSDLSASERSRRLIPYMAFYLPAPELPINQQYATKHSSSAGGAQLQAPPPGRIPVPVAYMPQQQQKHHTHHLGPPHPPPASHYQSGAAEVYHSMAIGSHQHSHPHSHPYPHPHPPPGHVKEQQQQQPLSDSGATFIAYKPLNPSHKHKTVQHFPPLPPPKEQVQQPQQQQQHLLLHHHQQQQHHQQPQQFEMLSPGLVAASQLQRQRGKQSKINLTPFTAKNTLPGQFIPIIYTPVSSSSSSGSKPGSTNPINYNNINNGNLKQPEIVYQAQAPHKNSHQTQIVGVLASAEQPPPPASSSEEEKSGEAEEEQHQQQQEDHRAPEEAVEVEEQQQQQQPTPSIGYASVSVPDASSVTAATTSTKTALILHQKSPTYSGHVSKYESYFNMAPPTHPQHPSHLTPQEKYVLYLQQRMKHQKYQQLQQQQQQQQNYDFPHPVVVAAQSSNTLAGSHHPPNTHLHPHQPAHHHPQTQIHHPNKYDGGLYGGQQQQVLHIPLRALMAHVQEQTHSESQFAKDEALGSPAPAQYIDYLIDGPRQSLDEEQQQQQQQHERPLVHQPAPQHAYILVTTTAPHIEHQPAPQLHPEISSTPRPQVLYKQQPTLRLQPVHNYKATRRPIYVTAPPPGAPPTPSHTVEITPKYVYVSGKPPSAPHSPELPLREPSTVTPIKLKPVFKYAHERPPLTPAYVPQSEDDQLPDIRTSSLAEILHKLQASNHLPQTLTPENIDNSIKTLIRILQNLKQTQTIVANPPQHHEQEEHKHSSQDYDYNSEDDHHTTSTGSEEEAVSKLKGPNKHPGPSTGRAGIDYPNYAEIPKTSFECTQQRYKGFFGDPDTNCQVWHYCDLNGGKASFLCPNGTIFSQIALTCDWWFNVKCSTTSQLYVLNERLYKYILPFNPKFPEDYNGPIVDKYLAMKFQEMEEKMRQEKQRKAAQQAEKPAEVSSSTPSLPKNHKPEPKHVGSGINAQVYEQSSERNLLIDDEIDDISERGSYDTFEQSQPTTIMAPTSTQDDTKSYVLKPIVVSSTQQPLPEIDFAVEPTAPESSEEEDKLQSLRETKEAEKKVGRETTKVSVEKLEVIEIKTDGNTGQLMPIKRSSSSK